VRTQGGRDRGIDRKLIQVATVRHLTNGEYLVQVSDTELALIKTALRQTGRLSRFGMDALDGEDQATNVRRLENTRLRREAEALAMREASLRSLQKTMAEAHQMQAVPFPRRPSSLS
jgi:hypothetical protein